MLPMKGFEQQFGTHKFVILKDGCYIKMLLLKLHTVEMVHNV